MKAKINLHLHTLTTLIGGSVLFSFSPAYMAAGTTGFIVAAGTALFTTVTVDLFDQLTKTFLADDLPELQKQNGPAKTKFGKKLHNTGKVFTKHSSAIALSIGIITVIMLGLP